MGIKKVLLIIEALSIVFIPIVFGSLLFTTPFAGDLNLIDEGQFAAWANHMVNGKLMYRDIYITYGPLLAWPLYLLFKVFGPSAFLVRIFLIVFSQILSSLIVALVIHKFSISRLTKLIMVLFILVFPGVNIRMGVAYLTILLLLLSRSKKQLKVKFFLGVSCVFSLLISPETGVFCFALVFLHILHDLITSQNIKKAVNRAIHILAGIIFAMVIFIYWSLSENWFWPYVNTTLDVFFTFSGINLPNGQEYPNPFALFPYNLGVLSWLKFVVSQKMLLYWQAFFYISIFIYLGIKKQLSKFNGDDFILMLINLYATFLYITLIGKHGGYYLTFAPILIYSIYFASKLIEIIRTTKKIKEKFTSILLAVFLILVILRLLLLFRPHFNKFFTTPTAIFSEKNNIDEVGPMVLSSQQALYISQIQQFILKNTKEKDYVFILTNEPFMYMFFNRLNPTRYDLPFVAATIEKRHEMLNDIKKRKPIYIIEDTGAWQIDGISNRKRLPEVYKFITIYYEKDTKLGTVIVYKRK